MEKSSQEKYNIEKLEAVCSIDAEMELELLDKTKEQIAQEFKSICVIGATGTGKSATCNALVGDKQKEKFPEGSDSKSKTEKTSVSIEYFLGDELNKRFITIDTPGLADSENRDTQHIFNMVKTLQALEYVHCFLICLNFQNPRLDGNIQGMIAIFTQIFGDQFLKNVIICFTHYSYVPEMQARLPDPKKKTADFKKSFNELYNVELMDSQFVFLDNTFNSDKIGDKEGNYELQNRLCKIKEFAENSKVFYCYDIKTIMSQKDQLQKALADAKALSEKEKEDIRKSFNSTVKKLKSEQEKTKNDLETKVNVTKTELEDERKKRLIEQQKTKADLQAAEKEKEQEKEKAENLAKQVKKIEDENSKTLRKQQRIKAEHQQALQAIEKEKAQEKEKAEKLSIQVKKIEDEKAMAFENAKKAEKENQDLKNKLVNVQQNLTKMEANKTTFTTASRATEEEIKSEKSSNTNETLASFRSTLPSVSAETNLNRSEAESNFKHTIELCFLIDATASMGVYIERTKDQIKSIINEVRKTYPSCRFRVAIVAYRDYNTQGGGEQIETCKFTESVEKIVKFLGDLKTYGNSDCCEDINGGFQMALDRDLGWDQAETRLIIHFADSPCHGSDFHMNLSDIFPDGHESDIEWGTLFKKMHLLKICYAFMKITDDTDIMFHKFDELQKTRTDESRRSEFRQYHYQSDPQEFLIQMSDIIVGTIRQSFRGRFIQN